MDDTGFQEFIQQRKEAALQYVNGNAGPLGDMAAQSSPATFFGPAGGAVQGADEVMARYESDARIFDTGGKTDLQILHWGADGDVGYWVGFQNATARLKGKPEPAAMRLRVTEIFRKVKGEWRLVHRHADMLSTEKLP